MKSFTVIPAICLAVAVVAARPDAAFAGDVWAYSVQSDGDDNLYLINLTTGAATRIGPVGFGDVEGLSFQPGTGTLFGWNNGGALITIDLGTGVGGQVGPSGVSGQFDAGLTFDAAGDLFATKAGPAELYKVDPNTGLASLVGSTSGEEVIALEDAGVNDLWGVSQDSDSQPLDFVSVNKLTAATTVIGPMGLGSGVTHGVGIDDAPDGQLWGIADDGNIFTIDRATGQASIVATTLGGFEGVAVVPEPATLSLLATGAGLAFLRRRRLARSGSHVKGDSQ